MASASNNYPIRTQWIWDSSADPFSKSESAEWCTYSDVENMIIEEAFISGKTDAMLDDYRINFKYKLQICNNDANRQRPVKRMTLDRNDRHFREERFMPNPIAPIRPFGDQYGFVSPFVKEVAKHLKLNKDQLPSKNPIIVPEIVEKAAIGIIEEGKRLRKEREANQLAKKLL